MSKTKLDQLVLAGLIVLATLLYLSADSYTGIAQKTSAKYVRFLAFSLGGLCTYQLIANFMKAASNERFHLTDNFPRFLALVGALIAFAFSFGKLGFFIPAMIFIPAVAWLMGQRNVVLIVATTAGLLLSIQVIFVVLLGIPLPGPQL